MQTTAFNFSGCESPILAGVKRPVEHYPETDFERRRGQK
jgi:hypothetical protein